MYSSIEDIHMLVQQFEAATLPVEKWTHQAHLTVGLWYLLQHDKDECIIRLRSRIITLNNATNTPNSATRGYHETITLFWIWLLEEYLRRNNCIHTTATYNQFLNSAYQDKDMLFRFYSKDLLFSVKARAIWVEPDIRELDFEVIA